MKKQVFKYLLAMFILVGAAASANAQARIYVKVRPTFTVAERPAMPHAHYVWVDDEWRIENGAYVHVPGYWAAPRPGFIWVRGHWSSERRGDYWVPGHWRRA